METTLRVKAANLLRAFRFPVYWITGEPHCGEGKLRILYAGSNPLRAYLNSVAFRDCPSSEYLGKKTHIGFDRVATQLRPDLEFVRSHKLLASSGLFPNWLFMPEWFAGYADLTQQSEYERHSKSRQRERKLMARNEVSYSISTEIPELEFFYDEMYLPHIRNAHGDGALFMGKARMLAHVRESNGELVVIYLRGKPVAGSFVVYEQEAPRLFSGGVLGGDRKLLRLGVGSAIYLCTFDHLRSKGYSRVHMGRTRALLSDGALYFKQRFGLTVTAVSEVGVLVRAGCRTAPLVQFLMNNGFIHYKDNIIRAAVLGSAGNSAVTRQIRLAEGLGIRDFDSVSLRPNSAWKTQRTSNVRVAQDDS